MESGWFSIIGVIIGGILSPIGTWVVCHFKEKRDDKVYIRRKREELYLEAIDLLSFVQEKTELYSNPEDKKKVTMMAQFEFTKLRSRFTLYSSTRVRLAFFEFIPIAGIIYNLSNFEGNENLQLDQYLKLMSPEKFENLITMMKEEIGTLEKQKSKGFQCNLCPWIQSKF